MQPVHALNSVHMYSIIGDISSHLYNLDTVRGCSHGASGCHLRTPGSKQWVVSVPIPLRYWTAPSSDLTVQMHCIIRTTIAQFYVNQAVKRGAERQKVQPGSVTFLQRFGGALQLNLHDHLISNCKFGL